MSLYEAPYNHTLSEFEIIVIKHILCKGDDVKPYQQNKSQ